jgi:hypothetical protein
MALFPVRKDANARIIPQMGAVITQPRMQPFPAWEHWTVAPDGRIAFIFFEPYRVDFVAANRRVVQSAPIPFDRVRVDDALKKQYREERERPRMVMRGSRGGASTVEMMKMPYTEPGEWPEFLPPFLGTPSLVQTACSDPAPLRPGTPLYDIIDGQGKLCERVHSRRA